MGSETRIAIAGGGIGGLASALLLARFGHEVDLFERAPALSEVGAGIQLSPNVGRVLSALGLDAALDAKAVRPDHVAMRSGRDGREITRVTLGDTAEVRFGAPYRVIHRADLQAILLAAAEADPRIALHLDAPVTHLRTEGDAIELTVADETWRAPLLVGADGVRSVVRAAIDGRTARPTGQTAWRTIIPADPHDEQAARRVDLWLAPDAHVVRYPIAAGTLTNIVVVTADRPGDPSQPDEATALPTGVGRRLAPDLQALLARSDSWTRWPLAAVAPDARWVRGPIALVGDAAHAMLPFLAQGGAMAIEDACELAAAIALHGPTSQALVAYERRRKPRVVPIWREARRLERVYHLGFPAAIARNLTMATLGPDRLLRRMDRIYGWRPSTLPA
ncbi:FAD-dependent monooxygenase [Amorphus sp. 3PC139-8]|uniref:FAD-dependent monooxygenase n=1 Tax=Amorphus sp. 3PC139-8 TaxID=2735676 RepID=UPI00345DBD2A